MEIITSYEHALALTSKYIDNISNSIHKPYAVKSKADLPSEVKNKKWEMSTTALNNTFQYIFHKLYHPCYLLCIADNKPTIYKIVIADSSPTFDYAIKKYHMPRIDQNPLITPHQKNFIKSELKDPVRVMQCILKKRYTPSRDKTRRLNEYYDVMDGMQIPNGMFILNMTDAVILRNDGTEPFPMVTGSKRLGKYNFSHHIPIMSMSGQAGYSDIPIPNYDDIINIYDDNKMLEYTTYITTWENKKISKAVFRGGPSGCGYTPESNMRLKLKTINSKYLDVELTGKGRTIDSMSIKFDPVYGLGMLNTGIKPAPAFLTMLEQSNYKYIIHVDGNVIAYRLLTTMRTGSLILRVASPYRSWFDHLIQPSVHYIEIKQDLSDLKERLDWCIKNDTKCKEIAQNGLNFAISILRKDFLKSYFQKILWSLSDYQQPTKKATTKQASKSSKPAKQTPKA